MAWVTGGAGGIGSAVVRDLVASGARVGILDVQPSDDPDATWVEGDLRSAASTTAAVAQLRSAVGDPHILVHCAGVAGGRPVAELSDEQWEHVMSVNLTGAFRVTRAVLPAMWAAGWGRIVSISSGTAVRVGAGTAAYSASKAGLIALTKVVALESAPHGVTANVVAPGVVDTPMTRASFGSSEAVRQAAVSGPIANPMASPLDPGDIAAAVMFLAGDGAAHITGQVLHVNAGSLMP